MARRVCDLCGTALVTGAGSGLGRAFAAMLAGEGVRVWGTSRSGAPFPGAPDVAAVAMDLADPAGAVAAYDRAAAAAGGSFDLLVNNAGYGVFGGFAATDASVWEAQLRAMLVATALLAHRAFAAMRAADRGVLVNVSSLAVEFPPPFMSGYNAAKAGLSALSESLAFESRKTGVSVIDFRPGDYRTAFNLAMQAASPQSAPPAGAAGRAWRALQAHLDAAPPPERAAADLRRALLGGRRGVVRSGSFFQARLAPALARFAPEAILRAARARYFGCD